MSLNIFKNRPRYVDVESGMGGTGKNKFIIILIIIAIFVLAFWDFDTNKKTETAKTDDKNIVILDEYIAENERRLEEILTAVQGAGKVKTMITVSEMSEKVVATDKKSDIKQETEKENLLRNSSQESITVIYGTGSEEKPFVIKEKLPTPSGVVVTATGAGDESVRLELYEAVKALYGLSGHRIKITKGNIK